LKNVGVCLANHRHFLDAAGIFTTTLHGEDNVMSSGTKMSGSMEVNGSSHAQDAPSAGMRPKL
jgi:hypothetical protein